MRAHHCPSQYSIIIILVILLMIPTLSKAQKKDSTSFIPQVGGVIRAKYEYNTSVGKGRFEVRNARFSVGGYVSKVFNYKAEIDLSDEGVTKMLDAYVRFIPIKNLFFTLGQMKIPFSTDNLRSPGQLNFSNRSFIAKRICKDLRDIGFMVSYAHEGKFPFALHAGIFSGSGINTAAWVKTYNLGLRFELGPFKGASLSGNYYSGKVSGLNSRLFDVGINYRYKNFFFDAEYAQKKATDTTGSINSNALFAYVLYEINFKKGIMRNIVPAVRYDFFTSDISTGVIEPARITTGLTFGFHKISWADIRLSYEKYIYRTQPDLDDKATIEFIARF
jgi:hypothetical protein